MAKTDDKPDYLRSVYERSDPQPHSNERPDRWLVINLVLICILFAVAIAVMFGWTT
jgi:hypothetical protein